MSATSSIKPGDSLRTNERYPTWDKVIPLPPESLLWSVGGSSLELFLLVGDAWMQAMAPYIQAGTKVLDIGCGCGHSARTLLPNSNVTRYVGFDVIPENIGWCQRFIEPLSGGRACFLHYDIYSAEYRPQGVLRASDLKFPCEDRSVDLIIAASLFTHLLEPDAAHYLREIGRVISQRGHALLSIHTDVPAGTNYAGGESRIDVALEVGEASDAVTITAEASMLKTESARSISARALEGTTRPRYLSLHPRGQALPDGPEARGQRPRFARHAGNDAPVRPRCARRYIFWGARGGRGLQVLLRLTERRRFALRAGLAHHHHRFRHRQDQARPVGGGDRVDRRNRLAP